jgi:uncharacterized protein YyaL (SSP411 family)
LSKVDGEKPQSLLCVNQTCQPPMTEPEELAAAIANTAR